MTPAELRAIRIEAGLSQKSFAEALGYSSFEAINRKESGKYKISRQDEIIIAMKFGREAIKLNIDVKSI
jgi:transcriptional regulator with XRE-family HTH domain